MKRTLIVAACIALGTFLVYLPAIKNGFVRWDDDFYVYQNAHIQDRRPELVAWAFTDVASANWHPLTWLSHALDYAFWGNDPRGHHLTNILLHALNAMLVFLLLLRLLEASRGPGAGGVHGGAQEGREKDIVIAALAAVLFGIHPLHVESVAWVAERKDVLCSFFFLSSLLFYVLYAIPGGAGTTRPSLSFFSYSVSLMLFAFALMSKAMAVTLPGVLLIIDWYPLQRFRSAASARRVMVEKIPFALFGLATAAVAVVAQQSQGAITWKIPLGTRLQVAVQAVVTYAAKMAWPERLSPFYPYPEHPSWKDPHILLSVFLLLAAIAGAVWQRRKPVYGAVLAYYLITLLPVLGLLQIGYHSMADRYTYLPSLGPLLLLGMAGHGLYARAQRVSRGRRAATAGLLLALVAVAFSLVVLTRSQIRIWKDDVSLWSRAVSVGPPNAKAFDKLASALLTAGRPADALAYYERAETASLLPGLYPSLADNLKNRALCYLDLAEPEKALALVERARELDADDPDIRNTLGEILFAKKDYRGAYEEFIAALGSAPDMPNYLYNISLTLERMGDIGSACGQWGRYVDTKPEDVQFVRSHMAEIGCPGKTLLR